jgi:transposase-like protein
MASESATKPAGETSGPLDIQTVPKAISRLEAVPEIVERYLAGESLQILAAEHAVSRQTLYNWMLSGLGDRAYKDLVTTCLINRIAESDQDLDSASSALDIARAREKARFARMDFERRRPSLYGQQQVAAPAVQVAVQINLKRGEGETNAAHHAIDADVEGAEQS